MCCHAYIITCCVILCALLLFSASLCSVLLLVLMSCFIFFVFSSLMWFELCASYYCLLQQLLCTFVCRRPYACMRVCVFACVCVLDTTSVSRSFLFFVSVRVWFRVLHAVTGCTILFSVGGGLSNGISQSYCRMSS